MNSVVNNIKKSPYMLFPVALVLTEIIVFLATDMYLPALPQIATDFNVGQGLAQYTQTFWFLGSTSLQLFLGPLCEKYSRKSVLSCSVILFIISSFICATTENIYFFILARFIQGTTVCSVFVAGYATIHELYSGARAVQILAIMGSITILAPALGPVVGAFVITYTGSWQNIFHVLTLLAIIALLGIYWYMPSMDSVKNHTTKIQLKNSLNDYYNILTNKNFMLISLCNCMIIICFFVWIVESPFIIIEAHQKSQIFFGMVQFFVFLGFIIGSQTSKRLIVRIEARRLSDLGISVVILSVLMFTFFSSLVTYRVVYIYPVIAAMAFIAIGASMLSGLFNRLAISSVQNEPMGHRVAVFSTLVSLAATIGSYIVTNIDNMSFLHLAQIMLIFIVIACMIYINIRKKLVLS